jgi:hypothetical protein
MKRRLRLVLLVVLLLIVFAQFLQPLRTNPPVTADFTAPAEVKAVLQRSCYDCHSNETDWPWYSNISPVSWFLVQHVDEGREHLNFSRWGEYDTGRQVRLAEHMVDETQEGEMPLSSYLLLHPSASLSDADKQLIREWSDTVGRSEAANR